MSVDWIPSDLAPNDSAYQTQSIIAIYNFSTAITSGKVSTNLNV